MFYSAAARRLLLEAMQLLREGSEVAWTYPASSSLEASTGRLNTGVLSARHMREGGELDVTVSSFLNGKGTTAAAVAPNSARSEGDLDCARSLVDVCCAYTALLSEECCSSALRGAADLDFRALLSAIDEAVSLSLERVTAVAGSSSILAAELLERGAAATFSALQAMHCLSTTFGGLSVFDYTAWFDQELCACVRSTTRSVEIWREQCAGLTEEDLSFNIPAGKINWVSTTVATGSTTDCTQLLSAGAMKLPDALDGFKKGTKAVIPKAPTGKKATKGPEQDSEALKSIPKSGPRSFDENTIFLAEGPRCLFSSLQKGLARTECLLATQKYHLGVFRGHNVSAGGGLSLAQQRRQLAELTPPERYLEMSKPAAAVKTEDFEVRPIGEGILLSASALQALSMTPNVTETAPFGSVCSRACAESAALYSAGFTMQLTGAGAFNSMWTSSKEGDEDFNSTTSRPSSVPLPLPGLPSVGLPSVPGDIATKKKGEFSIDAQGDRDEVVCTQPSAIAARAELAVQTVRAIATRNFEVASRGSDALVAAFGCRQVRSAVCWLLQLQR